MLLVKGTYRNGVIQPDEPITATEGQSVIITFVETEPKTEEDTAEATIEAGWEEFDRILEECQIETGIPDFAHQHDHYIHGTPKRELYPRTQFL